MESILSPGSIVGQRFRLVRKIGQGAAGQVWVAEDMHLDNDAVACKFLNDRFVHDRCAVADLKREVLLTRRLRHPHILGVYTFWEWEETRFITMEYIAGDSLAELLEQRKKPFPLGQVLPWAQALCSALDYAHSQQILHRDIKPGNILLAVDGTIRVVDFGIARTIRETCLRFRGGTTSGTLMFISPEQLLGKPLDGRSDLYSLAATLYTLLNGKPPFHQGSVVAQVQLKPAPAIPYLPPPINRVLLRALAKDPASRYPTCGAFFEELAAAARDEGATQVECPDVSPPIAACDSNVTTVYLAYVDPEGPKRRLGHLLIADGILSQRQLEQALRDQKTSRDRLGEVLVRLGFATERQIAGAIARQLDVPFVTLENEPIDREVARLVPGHLAESGKFIPLRRGRDHIVVAMADPLDLVTLAHIEEVCNARVELRVATESDISAFLRDCFGDPADSVAPQTGPSLQP